MCIRGPDLGIEIALHGLVNRVFERGPFWAWVFACLFLAGISAAWGREKDLAPRPCSSFVAIFGALGMDSGIDFHGRAFDKNLEVFMETFLQEVKRLELGREDLRGLLEDPKMGRITERTAHHRLLNEILNAVRTRIREVAPHRADLFSQNLAARIAGYLEERDASAQDARRVIIEKQQPLQSRVIRLGTGISALGLLESERLLLVGTVLGNIHFYDLDGYRLQDVLGAFDSSLTSFGIPFHGQFFLAGSSKGVVKRWNLLPGGRISDRKGSRVLTHNERIASIALSPDSSLMASVGSDRSALVRELGQGSRPLFNPPTARQGLHTILFGPDGESLFYVPEDNRIVRWNFREGRIIQNYADSIAEIYDLKLSPDGKYLVGAGGGEFIRIWDVNTGVQEAFFGAKNRTSHRYIQLDPNGKTLVSAGFDGILRFWNWRERSEVFQIPSTARRISGVAWPHQLNRVFWSQADGLLHIQALPNDLGSSGNNSKP